MHFFLLQYGKTTITAQQRLLWN